MTQRPPLSPTKSLAFRFNPAVRLNSYKSVGLGEDHKQLTKDQEAG